MESGHDTGWRTGFADAQHVEALRQLKVTHVLTVASRLRVWSDGRGEGDDAGPPPGITHVQLHIDDHPDADLLAVLPAALSFLGEALGRAWPPPAHRGNFVLVHCASGISRSAAVVAAFLMDSAGMAYEDALAYIKRGRRFANPNVGFRHQLLALQEARGNLVTAKKIYRKMIQPMGEERGVRDFIRIQRETANALHARVDEMEDSVSSITFRQKEDEYKDGISQLFQQLEEGFKDELLACIQLLEEENARANGTTFLDRPAHIIRSSASKKAKRLLESLDK